MQCRRDCRGLTGLCVRAPCSNIKELARHYKVYALDMIGFGRSSRPKRRFKTPEQSEDFFLGYFEAWRQALKLDRFTLIGRKTPPSHLACFCGTRFSWLTMTIKTRSLSGRLSVVPLHH
jgi:hypothetical protein